MNIKGAIKRIEAVNQVSDKFKKQELIVEVQDGEYPQTLCIEFQQDKTSLLDDFAEGQEVDVAINLRGREWQKDDSSPIRVFNTLVGWKIEAVGEAKATEPSAADMMDDTEGSDDLPF